MATVLNMLEEILRLEQIEENIFRGRSPDEDLQRVFGGQVAGQALVAAGRTVPPDRLVHFRCTPTSSASAIPMCRSSTPSTGSATGAPSPPPGGRGPARPGDLRPVGIVPGRAGSGVPGGAHARSAGSRDGAGLAGTAQGIRHQSLLAGLRPLTGRSPLQVGDPPWAAQADGGPRAPRTMVWPRAHGSLLDDVLPYVCAVTYASDSTLLDAVLLGHGLAWDERSVTGASLDHAMWFHGPSAPISGSCTQESPVARAAAAWRGVDFPPRRPPHRVGRPGGPRPSSPMTDVRPAAPPNDVNRTQTTATNITGTQPSSYTSSRARQQLEQAGVLWHGPAAWYG